VKVKPSISVVLLSYNHARHIDLCIKAFLGQSVQDFELIIIDDASGDDSVERIRRYADHRITLVTREINRGVSAGMNSGLLVAKADLVCFFATDDIPDVEYLNAALAVMALVPRANAAYFPLRRIDEDGRLLEKFGSLPWGASRHEILHRSFMGGNQLPSPGMVVRREVALGMLLPEGSAQYSDWILHNRLLLHGEIALGDAPVLSYRVSPSSLSARSDKAIGREAAETRLMMDDFFQIHSMTRMAEIFGDDVAEFANLPDAHVPYVLGRLALRSQYYHKRCWGYETIMRHVSGPDVAESLASCLGFSHKEFLNLVPNPVDSPTMEIISLRRRLRRQKVASCLLLFAVVLAVLFLISRT